MTHCNDDIPESVRLVAERPPAPESFDWFGWQAAYQREALEREDREYRLTQARLDRERATRPVRPEDV